MQPEEQILAQDISHGREDGFPRSQGELNDAHEIVLVERADHRVVGHGDSKSIPLPGRARLGELALA